VGGGELGLLVRVECCFLWCFHGVLLLVLGWGWGLSGKFGNLVGASLADRNVPKNGVILDCLGLIGAIPEPLARDFGKGESLLRSILVCASHH